jgi:DNA-binding HxlR family transcriptional regulator
VRITDPPIGDGDVMNCIGAFQDRDAFTAEEWCPVEKALERVGTRSAMILLREVFYGSRRFGELARRTGLSEAVAATRLRQMVEDGLLARQPYREPGARARYEYVLTDRGRGLFPVIVALARVGRLLDPEGTGLELVHSGCGARLDVAVRCEAGHDVAIERTGARLTREGAADAGRADDDARE